MSSQVERYKSQFLHKTHETPRPSRTQEQYRRASDWVLEDAQAGWDAAKQVDDHLLHLRAQGVARRAEEEATRRMQEAERIAKARADADQKILAPAWQAFRASGGTVEEFEKAKPQILQQARLKAALDAANGAADQMQPLQLRADRIMRGRF